MRQRFARGCQDERHRLLRRAGRGVMTNAWGSLSHLNADLLALVASSVDLGWTLLAVGTAWPLWAPAALENDLMALGLDRMPSTTEELRRVYRRAVKAAHPD